MIIANTRTTTFTNTLNGKFPYKKVTTIMRYKYQQCIWYIQAQIILDYCQCRSSFQHCQALPNITQNHISLQLFRDRQIGNDNNKNNLPNASAA